MITETEIYWITRMTYLQNAVFGIGLTAFILSVVGLIVASICHAVNIASTASSYSSNEKMLPASRRGIKIFILSIILSWPILMIGCLIPTTKEMCAIKAIPMVINNEQVQEIPDKVLGLTNEWLEELRPNKNEVIKND